MTPHVLWLKPGTKVTIYNEGVGRGKGGTERGGARVNSPLGGGHAPAPPPLERDKARQIL